MKLMEMFGANLKLVELVAFKIETHERTVKKAHCITNPSHLLCSLFKRFDVVVDDVVLCFHFVDDSKGLKRTRQRFSYFDEQTREQTREQNSSKTPTRRPTSHRELPRQLLECRSP